MRKTAAQEAVYETGRVIVRLLRMQDVRGNYAKWFNDPEVCRFNSHGSFPMTPRNLESYVSSLSQDKSRVVWAVVDKASGEHIGNISLQAIDWISRTAELAVIMGEKAFWNKGYAKEAAGLLVRHGFDKMNLQRIYCGTAARNKGMRKLALALGMREEGVRKRALFVDGGYDDCVEFGLLKKL